MTLPVLHMKTYICILFAGLAVFISGCSLGDEDFAADGLSADLFSFFDFTQGLQGWEAGFAKYPSGEEDSLMLESSFEAFPSAVGIGGNTLRLAGKNPHRSLFYFIKREISGLKPATTYQLDFQMQFVVEVLESAKDASADVFVKVGAADIQPLAAPGDSLPDLGYATIDLNIDIGSEAFQRAPNAVAIGDIALPAEGSSGLFLTSNSKQTFTSQTDKDGTLWLMVGFDSFTDAWLAFYFNTLYIGYNEL